MFDDYFEVFLADTKEGREVHYNIRYQVYCEELGYEDTANFPDQQEYDKWDSQNDEDNRSSHFLVRLKHTGEWIGAMRVVHHDKILPLQEISSLDHEIDSPAIEISRLCLVKEIRKPFVQNAYGINEDKSNEPSLLDAQEDDAQVKNFYSNPKVKSTIIWGLFNAALKYSVVNDINKWYLLTNKALVRVIGRQGFAIEQVGETCEHRGKRSPYRFDVEEIQDNSIWDTFKNGYRAYSELSQTGKAALKVA